MKKIVVFLCFLVVLVLLIITVPYFIARDFDAIIDRQISLEDIDELYIEKEGLYYPKKKIIIKNDREIEEIFEYFKSFKYYLSSQNEFIVKEEPCTFIFKSQENSLYIEVFVYNKRSVSIRTKNGYEEYNIKGKGDFDFKYFKEILSRDEDI